MELNQKFAKAIPRRWSIRDVYTRDKYLCTNLRVKDVRGGGGGGGEAFALIFGNFCVL